VSLPTPLAPVIVLIAGGSRAALEPVYARAIGRELDEIVAALPAGELSIQWDVCQEVGLWEASTGRTGRETCAGTSSTSSRASPGRVPEPVELASTSATATTTTSTSCSRRTLAP